MQFKLLLIPAAVALLAACGGGGGGDNAATGTPSSGKAVDGYLSLAKVVCDSNGNGVADTGEPVTYTDTKGNFVFSTGCSQGVLASGGTSADTGLAFVGQLRAPAGATVVTPLTTLMASGMTQAEVNTALGLPAGTNLLTTDPAATKDGALLDSSLLKKTLAVQQMLQKTTELFTGLGAVAGSSATAAVYTEVAAAFATQLKTGDALFDNSGTVNSTKVNTLVSAAVTRTSTASTVSADIKTALTAAGSATLATVASEAIKSQAQAIVNASDANITAVTKDRQSNTTITDNVKTEVSAGRLKSDTSSAALQSMKDDVAAKAVVATVDTTTTQHVPTPATGSSRVLTFDESSPAFTDMGAYGGALPSVEAGPSSDAGSALKILKPTGAKDSDGRVVSWGGTYFGVSAIPFAANRKTLTAAVYSTKANAVIKLKVQVSLTDYVEVAGTSTGAANTWTTVTWDLSGVNPAKQYTTMAITPEADTATSGQSYYIDNLYLAPAGESTPTPQHAPTPATGSTTLLTFDESTPAFTGINAYGGALPSVETPPGSDAGAALKILKPAGVKSDGQDANWGGAYFGVTAIPFAANRKTLTAAVYSTKANAVIKLKVEGAGATAVEVVGTSTGAANTWSTVTWNLSGVDAAKQYTTIAITPDVDTVTSGQSYYIDNLALLAAEASAAPTDYIYLDSNSIGFSANGTTAAAVTYSMANFQSSTGGINIKWPMSNAAALKLNLKVNGNFSFAAGQKLSAAVRIQEDETGKYGKIRAYTDNVAISKSGNDITLSVPTTPNAIIYGVSSDGQTKAVIDFSSKVRGITNTLSTATGAVSTVMFGEVVNFGISGLSNQFNNMSAMRGKYKVTIVVNELPLRKADGTKFDTLSIDVPTTVSGGVAGSPIAVTGYGLVGYINLTD